MDSGHANPGIFVCRIRNNASTFRKTFGVTKFALPSETTLPNLILPPPCAFAEEKPGLKDARSRSERSKPPFSVWRKEAFKTQIEDPYQVVLLEPPEHPEQRTPKEKCRRSCHHSTAAVGLLCLTSPARGDDEPETPPLPAARPTVALALAAAAAAVPLLLREGSG